ncbi:MAG: AraC family transcriptional regulator [Fimbriimonas sp.]|nr:AraC family transcriptional regulator [Fimbriimonas sp.]
MVQSSRTHIVAADFVRPKTGPTFTAEDVDLKFTSSGSIAWQSNGGPHRGHPARSLPFSMEAKIDADFGPLVRVHLLGIFALFSGKEEESLGTLGASIQLSHSREPSFRQDLLNGRHYRDARDTTPLNLVNGDGTSLETLGTCEINHTPYRVDLLTIDVPTDTVAETVRFKDLGSPASFVVFDVLLEHAVSKGCPFQLKSGGISLGEIGSSIRIGDRLKFTRAMEQMETALRSTVDLDEARGEALTFLAVVTAATIEIGGTREMHRALLASARQFESIDTVEDLAEAVKTQAEAITASIFKEMHSPSSYLVDRALAMVERNYAKNLTDASVAALLGLSTSHFRFLFKEATGQPFHKFLVSLRLEKARQMLNEEEIAVSAVAKAVGFAGLSHFSRAFTQRFQVSPTSIRRGGE